MLVALTLVFGGLGVTTPATAAPAAASSTDELFCQSIGINKWCRLAGKIIVQKGYFNASGDYCRNIKNGYPTRKGVALDVGSSLGKFHRVKPGKKLTICRAVADKRLRVNLRVRMDKEVQQYAGTWLIARDPAKRVVTKRQVPTQRDPNVKLCAHNTMKRKAMLFMFFGEAQVAKTKSHIRPGKVGCVAVGLAGSGTATMKVVWMNAYGARGVEAWVVRN